MDIIISVKLVKEKHGYLLQQKNYLEDIIENFDMSKYKIVKNMILEEN